MAIGNLFRRNKDYSSYPVGSDLFAEPAIDFDDQFLSTTKSPGDAQPPSFRNAPQFVEVDETPRRTDPHHSDLQHHSVEHRIQRPARKPLSSPLTTLSAIQLIVARHAQQVKATAKPIYQAAS